MNQGLAASPNRRGMPALTLASLLLAAGLACGPSDNGTEAASDTTVSTSGSDASIQASPRINPMIELHEMGLPVFGISHPPLTAGRDGGEAPELSAVVDETVAYTQADFTYGGAVTPRVLEFMDALGEAGASSTSHPFIAKTLILHSQRDEALARIHSQLDAGHVGIMTEEVESAQEIRDAVAAMRFESAGGLRPDGDVSRAAAWWGVTADEYREKADVWPLNPAGELILWAIVESREGIANIREIAAEPGLGVLWAGWGSLGGVYRDDPEGRQAAADAILAACREFDVPCGFPAFSPEDVDRLMDEGWSVFVMQGWNEASRETIEAGRRISGR
ncbi:MAG: aldolase/citrate lyase family protein [Gemmatimonadota bacterium]